MQLNNAPARECGLNVRWSTVFKTHPELRSYEAVPTYPKAGSVSFHNGLLAHGAAANMSQRRRRAMTCALMPDGATFNGQQNVFTDAQVAKYKLGTRQVKAAPLFHAKRCCSKDVRGERNCHRMILRLMPALA